MIIMSVDYGDVRSGVAVCDKNEILASPVTVITEKDADVLIEKIMYLANERNVQMFVVGLPKNMDGSEGFRAQACREVECDGLPVFIRKSFLRFPPALFVPLRCRRRPVFHRSRGVHSGKTGRPGCTSRESA